MAGIFGLAGLSASDYQFVNTAGQRIIYDATQQYLQRVNQDMQLALGMFVESSTTDFQERYQLPGGGRLQAIGRQSSPAAVRASGSWDVAYPLEEYGAQVATSRRDMAYMTPAEYERHVQTVVNQDANLVRFLVLKALLKNTTTSFADPERGTLTIQTLANGDAVVYPPVLGSESEATDNHYLESGYAASSISDSNNPIATMRDELEEHFGTTTGGNNIVIFHNNAQTAQLKALTDFDEVPDRFLRTGDNVNVPSGLPGNIPTTARVTGRGSGCWLVEWRHIPANYMVGIDADQPAPLKMRVDPTETGLGTGLNLVAQDMTDFPLQKAVWTHAVGFGVGNRLNGCVMELGTGGTYSIPSGYS
jgi:hypothetical protein